MKKLLTIVLAASMALALSVNSFALGNYVLSTDALDSEEPIAEEPVEEEPTTEEPVEAEIVKPNPDTGAESFVGVAAAAAAIAGIGLVALKKK